MAQALPSRLVEAGRGSGLPKLVGGRGSGLPKLVGGSRAWLRPSHWFSQCSLGLTPLAVFQELQHQLQHQLQNQFQQQVKSLLKLYTNIWKQLLRVAMHSVGK